MTNWAPIRLGEVADFRNGLNYTDADLGNGLAVIGVSDFQDNVTADLRGLSQLDMSALSKVDALVQQGDIIFVRSNGNRELIGRSLFLKDKPDIPTSHSGFTIRCRFRDARCYPRFYAYLFRGPIIRQLLSAQGGGTNISNLNQGILAQLQVPLPGLELQHRIASTLSAYDDLIENNTRRIAILEEMARRIFEEWFVHFRAPGCEGLPMVDSAIGPIPKGWEVKPIGEAFEVTGGGTPSKAEPPFWENGTINWFTPSDLTGSCCHFLDASGLQITDLGLQKSSARMFAPYSVMMTSRATLGVFAINTTAAATNQGFITCLPNAEVPLYFLYFWLQENAAEFERHASGATFKEITKGTFKKLQMGLPPSRLRRSFDETVGPMMRLILNLERQIRNLRAQRDLLLPKLISGEIDVSRSAAALPEAAE
jgi:type I restriction enzyme, S subunit